MNLIPKILDNMSTEGFVQRYDTVRLKTEPVTEEERPLLHLSHHRLDSLTARVPKGGLAKSGDEDATTKRISVTSSIDLCLVAMASNIAFQKLYVHEPSDYTKLQFVPNSLIVKHKLVPDAHITRESWILRPRLEATCIGKIKVGKAIPNKYVEYDYHDFETEKKLRARAYFFEWEWVEAYYIGFPEEEHQELRSRLDDGKLLVTTRISEELTKYRVNDILDTDLTEQKLKIIKVQSFKDIRKHPYFDELSIDQRVELTSAKEFTVLWLQEIP